jgi:hypothetical protein
MMEYFLSSVSLAAGRKLPSSNTHAVMFSDGMASIIYQSFYNASPLF